MAADNRLPLASADITPLCTTSSEAMNKNYLKILIEDEQTHRSNLDSYLIHTYGSVKNGIIDEGSSWSRRYSLLKEKFLRHAHNRNGEGMRSTHTRLESMERKSIDMMTDPDNSERGLIVIKEDVQSNKTTQAESENATLVGCAEIRRFYEFRVLALRYLLHNA